MPLLHEVQQKYPRSWLFIILALASSLLIAAHFALWFGITQSQGRSWFDLLSAWDAGWYLRIALDGYDRASSAFLPLYPGLVRAMGLAFDLPRPAGYLWAGILLSILCQFAALFWLCKLKLREDTAQRLFPLSGSLLFLTSPASYVFHTFHTESLFLLSSILAFLALGRQRLYWAAFWAGVAALNRHQGVFLAIAIGVGMAMDGGGNGLQRLGRFVRVGLISGALWGLTPLLHLWRGRSAFPAFDAHSENWFIADGISSYFKTFIFANPIQNMRIGSILHHGFYFLLLAATIELLRRRRWAEGVYCLLSLAILPLQGELVDSFRFGAVLFPLYSIAAAAASKLPRALCWILGGLYLVFNLVVAYQYGIQRWAY